MFKSTNAVCLSSVAKNNYVFITAPSYFITKSKELICKNIGGSDSDGKHADWCQPQVYMIYGRHRGDKNVDQKPNKISEAVQICQCCQLKY